MCQFVCLCECTHGNVTIVCQRLCVSSLFGEGQLCAPEISAQGEVENPFPSFRRGLWCRRISGPYRLQARRLQALGVLENGPRLGFWALPLSTV